MKYADNFKESGLHK